MKTSLISTERPRFQQKNLANGLELAIALPGVSQEQLAVKVEHRVLVITGERRFEDGPENRNYLLKFALHHDFDPSTIEANHQNGVLKLKIMKRAELAPRIVDVSVN